MAAREVNVRAAVSRADAQGSPSAVMVAMGQAVKSQQQKHWWCRRRTTHRQHWHALQELQAADMEQAADVEQAADGKAGSRCGAGS